MKKFSNVSEAKVFYPDPSIIKNYATPIIALYIIGKLSCDQRLIDEWLEMHKGVEKLKNANVLCDLDILAIKNIHENPNTQAGYNQVKLDIENKCIKLETFMRKFYIKF